MAPPIVFARDMSVSFAINLAPWLDLYVCAVSRPRQGLGVSCTRTLCVIGGLVKPPWLAFFIAAVARAHCARSWRPRRTRWAGQT